ncbi:MAG TPA: hypothetical protein VH575_30460 [Gemmataceae bacterium]|jgi:hypothetical protein
MELEESRDRAGEVGQATAAQFSDEPQPGEVRAWEQVDTGRFMPRRIRGSYQGRALG